MLTVAVLAGFLALTNAHMMGHMGQAQGGNWGQFGQGSYMNQGMQQGGMQQMNLMNLIQHMMSGGMQNGMGGGMMGGGQMGGGQMGGGMMGGQMGGGQMNQPNLMNALMMMMFQNMMQNNGRQQGDRDQGMDWSEDEMEEVKKMMKKKMMVEMAEMMMAYMDYNEKKDQFSEAMEGLCFMVNATYVAYKQAGREIFNFTTDESVESLGAELEKLTDEQIMNRVVGIFNSNEEQYGEIFFRLAVWACMTGDSYMKAAVKMDKMSDDM
ncbi:hypothetical protein ACF0H5_001401 [Mactra antiquata]